MGGAVRRAVHRPGHGPGVHLHGAAHRPGHRRCVAVGHHDPFPGSRPPSPQDPEEAPGLRAFLHGRRRHGPAVPGIALEPVLRAKPGRNWRRRRRAHAGDLVVRPHRPGRARPAELLPSRVVAHTWHNCLRAVLRPVLGNRAVLRHVQNRQRHREAPVPVGAYRRGRHGSAGRTAVR